MERIFSSLVAFFTAIASVISGSPTQATNPVITPVVEQIAPRVETSVPTTVTKRAPKVKTENVAPSPAPILEPEQKMEYLPTPSVVSTTVNSTEPARTYTNEIGQIVTENGTVLWSPPKPVVAPTPTTTTEIVDQYEACGYELALGLPLGSKCRPTTEPFPCHPNQPWTCRPSGGVQQNDQMQGGSIPNLYAQDGSLKKPCPADVVGLGQKWCI